MSNLLSIITICYNDLEGLRQTVESLRVQTSFDFEHWIIDGGSRDGSAEYLRDLQVPWRLSWISERDHGIYDAMNKGTAKAAGRFIWYLNSGDLCADSMTVSSILKTLEESPDLDILYAKVWVQSEFGRRSVGKPVTAADFSVRMPVCHQGLVYRRDLVRTKPYPTDFRIISDWIVTREIFRRSPKTRFLEREIAIFNFEGVSSSNHMKTFKEKLRYEKSWLDKVKMAIAEGGKFSALWLAKKSSFYGLFKKWQHDRKET